MDKKCIDMRCFIFTGTPGSGKTSVVRKLDKHGYSVIHEAATDLILDMKLNGIETPWELPHFIDEIVYCQKERQMNAGGDLQFYDRSPFCTYALSKYLSQASDVLLEEINRCLKLKIYQKTVFFFENLGFIEHTDARKISYEDALIFEKIHLNVYKEFDFDVIMVPKELNVEQRCSFLKRLI